VKPSKIVPLHSHPRLDHPPEAAVEVVMRPTASRSAPVPPPMSTSADHPLVIGLVLVGAAAVGLLLWNQSHAARADRAEAALQQSQVEAARMETQLDAIHRVVCPTP